jgi:diguanylate cyclase (GGDEF)-like protein/PAS domain S-box-containing protein
VDSVLVRRYGGLIAGFAVLLGILALRQVSYLLFHTTVEIVSVVVSLGIFTLAWSLRKSLEDRYLLLVGLASLFIGIVDLLHALTYKGMSILPGIDADTPTQFWIAGRYIQSLTFLAAPLVLNRRLRTTLVMSIYTVATVVLTWLVITDIFPHCYVEGVGLTPFKKISEYVVAAVLAAGLYLLRQQKDAFDADSMRLLTWALSLTIVGELAFTLYTGVYDYLNLAGHLVRLSANYLLYTAMVGSALARPLDLLYRNLKRSEAELQQERNFSEGVLDSAPALMIVTDPNGRIVRFNKACRELSGYTADDVVGKEIFKVLLPADHLSHPEPGRSGMRPGAGHPMVTESRWRLKHGEERWISWSLTSLTGEDGQPAYVVGTGVDVTERRQAEEELKDREERLRTMVESVQTGMLLIDRTTRTIINANPASAGLIGLSPEQIVGRSCREFFQCAHHGDTCPLDEGVDLGEFESVLMTAAGQEMPIHRTATPVTADGRECAMESFIDMSRHKRMEEELRSLSMVDELTGLYNRRGFMMLAQKEIDAALRVAGSLALLYIDVNGLKEINDNYGHTEGDRVLVAMSKVLKEAFRETNLIARIGGDEFVVMVPQYVGARPALLVDRLLRILEDFNTTSGRTYEIGVATGVARLQPDRPCSVLELITQADTNMYVEKRRRAMTGSGTFRAN